MAIKDKELLPEQLRRTCGPSQFDFETTEEVIPSPGVIAQDRALKAVHFGVNIRDFGYNMYVAGVPGTGKTSIIRSFVEEAARSQPVSCDWCYVHNFKQPDKPEALELPAGKGRVLEADMRELIDGLKEEIPKLFESEDYSKRKDEIARRFRSRRDELIAALEQKAAQRGFMLQGTPMGLQTVPVGPDGSPLTSEQLQALTDAQREELRRGAEELQEAMNNLTRSMRKLEKEARDELKNLDAEIANFAVANPIEELKEKYRVLPQVENYLSHVKEDILGNIDDFKKPEEEPQLPMLRMPMGPPPLERYQVNAVVDNSGSQGAPVILEPNPTYSNLFGRLERRAQFGVLVTNFTMIKAGALHRANGGYLILNALDVLRNYFSWDGLKRAIKNKEIRIEDLGEQLGFIATQGLRPEPIPLKAKIVLIGNPLIYRLLFYLDEDFRKIFKVKVDFDVEMNWSPDYLNQFAAFVAARCREENLKPFHREGVARVVEYAATVAGDQERLSARFADITDIIRESSYWAGTDGAPHVTAEHVDQAIKEKRYRSNLIEEKIREFIVRGDIMVDTQGEVVGQVNGLSVHMLGDFSFGRPVRITATTAMGRGGVVDIERESKLSGNIHSKGVLIFRGYLAKKYAQDKPLTLSASVCFEQSYEGVEGDSASSTELYALLSSLSGLPIKQGIAVTGSVNQNGEIQPIGGVNEKVEGFFHICKILGLTGDQGVLIPHQNVKNLMLKQEVVEAVREGKFHIWSANTADEGIEILTGVPAGEKNGNGKYPEGTVNYLVDQRLKQLAEGLRKFGAEEPKEALPTSNK